MKRVLFPALAMLGACEHGRSPKTIQCGARTAVEHRVLFTVDDLDATSFVAFRTALPPAIVVELDMGERIGGGYRPVMNSLGLPACPQLDATFTAEVDGLEGDLRGDGWTCSAGPIEEPLCEGIEVRFELAGRPEPQGHITLRDHTGTLSLDLPPP
ncbi:MAG: hypothetical protein JNL83_20030 [Myxococcales bacterium]|nr:hypothetical protein [Myxococcales bacterium]